MRKTVALVLGCASVFSAAAYQYVDPETVSWSQTPNQPYVTIGYTLQGGSAFVNLEVLTNGVGVGTIPAEDLTGDINALVAVGSHTVAWHVTDPGLVSSRLPKGAWSFRLRVQSRDPRAAYMVVTLANGAVTFCKDANALPYAIGAAEWRTTHMLFSRIPAAMTVARLGLGVTDYKNGAYTYQPAYERLFTNDYYMAVFETTIGQYMALGDGTNPARLQETSFNSCTSGTHKNLHVTDWKYHPVEKVSYTSALAIGATLTSRTASCGRGLTFTLPTEDEWEFACRGGRSSDVYNGCPVSKISATVNAIYVNYHTSKSYYGGANPGYHPNYADSMPVGSLTANPYGLYDILGNVREMVTAQYGGEVVSRGGYFNMSGEPMTAPCRQAVEGTATVDSTMGFRLICRLPNE